MGKLDSASVRALGGNHWVVGDFIIKFPPTTSHCSQSPGIISAGLPSFGFFFSFYLRWLINLSPPPLYSRIYVSFSRALFTDEPVYHTSASVGRMLGRFCLCLCGILISSTGGLMLTFSIESMAHGIIDRSQIQ